MPRRNFHKRFILKFEVTSDEDDAIEYRNGLLQRRWGHRYIVLVCKLYAAFDSGGKPDTCGGDRIGVPCGECPAATYWAGSKCSGCTAWSAIGWILCIALIFAGALGMKEGHLCGEKMSIEILELVACKTLWSICPLGVHNSFRLL